MDKKKIVFDIDGVLADFEKAFCEKFGYDNRNLYKLEDRYPNKINDIHKFVESKKVYEDLNPIHLGIYGILSAVEDDFEIYILSSRPKHVEKATINWMKKHNIPWHFMEIGIKNKVESIVKINPVFIVEDQLSICLECAKFNIRCILFDWLWNRTNNLPKLVTRVDSFESFPILSKELE